MPTPGLESRTRRRTLYTNETYQQARAALLHLPPRAAAIPRPAAPQERLEAAVWREICWPSEVFSHPLGITCVRPGANLEMEVESAGAAAVLLGALLPAKPLGEGDDAAQGIAGLRVAHVSERAVALSRPDGASVRLTGLNRSTFLGVLEQYHRSLVDNDLQAVGTGVVCGRLSHGLNDCPAPEGALPGTRRTAAMDVLASALLRRSALFHTTTTSYWVTVWQALGVEEWRCELYYAPGTDAGDALLKALRDPHFGVGSSGRSEHDERVYDEDGRERARIVTFETATMRGAGLQVRLRHSLAPEAARAYRLYAHGPAAVEEGRLRILFPTLAGNQISAEHS
jgi:hypothetical protein